MENYIYKKKRNSIDKIHSKTDNQTYNIGLSLEEKIKMGVVLPDFEFNQKHKIKFGNIDNLTGNVDINIVVKIDFSFLQGKMQNFPFSLFKSYVPKTVYISSTTTIVKGATPFAYTVKSKEITIWLQHL